MVDLPTEDRSPATIIRRGACTIAPRSSGVCARAQGAKRGHVES